MMIYDQEKLMHDLHLFKAAFDASYDGIHILDKDGYTLYINQACERIEGITMEMIGGKTVSQCVEEGIFNDSVTLEVLKRNTVITKKQKVKNGKEVLVTGTPIYNEDKEIIAVIVNTRDITALSTLEHELKKQEQLVSAFYNEFSKAASIQKLEDKLIMKSPVMKKALTTALNVAKVDSNILITGESGTGKSMFAQIIHDNSLRAAKPMVKIDCGAIPETLFESELFGYEKGAFTGADPRGKTGLVALADHGTLFLDEIGEVPLSLQVKLLRLIQENIFYKVGGDADTCRYQDHSRDQQRFVWDGRTRAVPRGSIL